MTFRRHEAYDIDDRDAVLGVGLLSVRANDVGGPRIGATALPVSLDVTEDRLFVRRGVTVTVLVIGWQ
jgi:hypothetical protein